MRHTCYFCSVRDVSEELICARWKGLDGRIGELLRRYCFDVSKWSSDRSSTRRPGSGRPRNTDIREQRHIVNAIVADLIRAEIILILSTRTARDLLHTPELRALLPLYLLTPTSQ